MLRNKNTLELSGIVANGGGLDLDVSNRNALELSGIAAAAARSGATLIFRGVGSLSALELSGIAASGKGRVIFAD
jgi:hypothetical protein